ncbi:metal-sensitive transcriptional regulator [Mesoplasma lactucae]|uniref:CsoR family transcriptional regulator n=1 Tax=Mesoplasma lactucae ATCC 49193 TaxID=81460 RepID=A0A291IRC5_9MOLU|nr:metal-sensitive transcriptional regulator [Mesoplasma lactucae]ATG97241.1 CsoR family transcriptional regulator [Mesoplasma lactucae ATCC 49193]ATZ20314.1 hypothetical protein MLACT_v1c04930 [Mesoplasma lactucae ATCC 49193]MCL8216485.1 Copper-sensing transcriptional repressor RicR [Mesoplasma lactucae ATCC 49193]
MSMKKTHRDEETIKLYTNHLNRIKGQIDGIIKMVNDDVYCLDIVNQINAIRGSLLSMDKKLVNEHIDHCVRHSSDLDESLDEIKTLIDKIAK